MKYAKAVIAVLVAAGGAIITALGTGGGTFSSVDGRHWLLAALAVLGSGAVVAWVENSTHPYVKAVVATLTAGLGSLVIALNDNHISQAEWVTAFVAAASGFIAVYQVKNTP